MKNKSCSVLFSSESRELSVRSHLSSCTSFSQLQTNTTSLRPMSFSLLNRAPDSSSLMLRNGFLFGTGPWVPSTRHMLCGYRLYLVLFLAFVLLKMPQNLPSNFLHFGMSSVLRFLLYGTVHKLENKSCGQRKTLENLLMMPSVGYPCIHYVFRVLILSNCI